MTGPLTAAVRAVLAAGFTTVTGARPVLTSGGPVRDLPDQAVYYANHSSHLDFATLWAVLPGRLRDRVRPVAARDYWSSGIRRLLAEGLFNAHLVDRTGSGGGRAHAGGAPSDQLAGMTAVLDAGDSLIIFPEGTRGTGETVAPFQSGLYHLARHDPAIPVIPVTLGNLGRILPKGELVPVPHLSSVTFHEPIAVAPGESRAEFLERARQVLLAGATAGAPGADAEVADEGDAT